MKRSVIIVAVILVAVFAAISVRKSARNTTVPETVEDSGLSAERKAEIRRFWDVHRRATGLMRQGAWEEATTAYREALAIDPQHEDALYYLGNMFFELERYEEAVTTWRRLAEVNPMSTRAHIQLGAVHSCGAEGAPFDLEVAEREFQRALDINKEETGPVVKLGEVYLLSGRSQQALTFFKAAVQSNFKSVEAHYLIGYLEWQRGGRAAALQALRQAAELSRAKQKPAGEPMGEGDTRTTGGGPMLTESASRRSLFAPHWMALKAWEHTEVSESRMDDEYEGLDQKLRLLLETERVK
jgi:tetratricopeptide (TPR) repeat protein